MIDDNTRQAIRAARYAAAGTADCAPSAIPVLLTEIDRLRNLVRDSNPAGDWEAMGVALDQEFDDRQELRSVGVIGSTSIPQQDR